MNESVCVWVHMQNLLERSITTTIKSPIDSLQFSGELNKTCYICNTILAISKTIHLQRTLRDRNIFLPSILVPVHYERGERCNIILVDVVTIHGSLAKAATAPTKYHLNTTSNFSHNECLIQRKVAGSHWLSTYSETAGIQEFKLSRYQFQTGNYLFHCGKGNKKHDLQK